ncbi:MAG: N-6 DNA methylase [Chloroflexi bacterium]|nr:N-6 DNA methylase [Chloroflexota bacterium]
MNFIENESEQKLRGGYYTPDDLAEFLVRWIAPRKPETILEPGCGDGVFLEKIGLHLDDTTVYGFEIDSSEAPKALCRAKSVGLTDITVHEIDFLGWAAEEIENDGVGFDAVVGNPPFIRYQYLPSLFQSRAARIFKDLDCKFTKHTNAWVPFVLASFALLRPGGRLAMVVPAEIIHVLHARSLREYIGENARKIILVDPEELWFSNTLQGAVLLLAEKRGDKYERAEGVGVYSVRGREFVNRDPDVIFDFPHPINGKTVEGKWTRALLEPRTRSLIDDLTALKSVRRFAEIATVDVGIVTGANKFFLVSDETVQRFGLDKWSHPMFGRSQHCPGIIYDQVQHISNAEKGYPTNFIWFKDRSVENSPAAKAYILQGEQSNLNKRYKCRVRKPWYAVPSVYSTQIGMLKRAHHVPRLILNELNAYTTDTAYRISVKEGTARQLVYNFVNPLTALSAELEGRHYGGGVLELVPSEIEQLLIPVPTNVKPELSLLDRLIRFESTDEVMQRQGRTILSPLGISISEQNELILGWKRLRDRRNRVTSKTVQSPCEQTRLL